MNKRKFRFVSLMSVLILMLTMFSPLAMMPASATENVCGRLDSGKIDLSGEQTSITISREGSLITGYCLKAGSAKQGYGPEYYTIAPVESIVVSHSSQKAISHYSYSYVDVVPEPPELVEAFPVAPSVIPAEVCEAPGTVFTPDTLGIAYSVSGPDGDGNVTVTAAALEGYFIAEGATTSWTLNLYDGATECPPAEEITFCDFSEGAPLTMSVEDAVDKGYIVPPRVGNIVFIDAEDFLIIVPGDYERCEGEVATPSPTPTKPVETPEPTVPVETPVPTTPVETPVPTTPVETPVPTTPVETPVPTTPVETPVPTEVPVTPEPTEEPAAPAPVVPAPPAPAAPSGTDTSTDTVAAATGLPDTGSGSAASSSNMLWQYAAVVAVFAALLGGAIGTRRKA